MNSVRVFCVLLAGACVVATGCGAADGENSFDGEDFDVPFETMNDPPPGGPNGYDPYCFEMSGVQQTYLNLMHGALVDSNGYLPSMPSLPAPPFWAFQKNCRREALHYLARCALSQTQTMKDPVTDITYTGYFGLATTWRDQALTSIDDQQWLSSCILQHLNGYNTPVNILLEGNRDNFYQDSTLQAQYPVKESIVWGNIWAKPFVPHACYFAEMSNACYSANDALEDRICDSTSLCGLELEGNCSTACTWTFLPGSPAYWNCGGMKSFRVRVHDFTQYGPQCNPPE